MATIHVKVVNPDRKVVVAEFDPQHPGDTHEVLVVGFPGEDNVYEVGDTALVRQRVAEGALEVVGGARQIAADLGKK